MITRKDQHSSSIREFMKGGKKHAVMTGLTPELPAKCRVFSIITLVPGASIGYHVHEGESELFYFMEGCGQVHDDDQIIDITAGDSMTTLSGHGHSVENTGDTDLVILAVVILD
ncbi:MAG: cupin domain-containing protein [Clostridia bacterium]|nr:cupin domain-containing protein [Clostridia bacterium]